MTDQLFACAEVIQVIRTTLTKRGRGDALADPVRRVTQYWSFGGELLWEDDPCQAEQNEPQESHLD